MAKRETFESFQTTQLLQHPSSDACNTHRYGWGLVDNTLHAVKFTFDSISINASPNNKNPDDNNTSQDVLKIRKNIAIRREQLCRHQTRTDNLMMRPLEGPQDPPQDTDGNLLCHHCAETIDFPREESILSEMQQKIEKHNADGSSSAATTTNGINLNNNTESISSMRSIGSFVCRICHNAENPERLVSPCLCKGTLSYVHTFCLEHWISTSGKTNCELCQFQYKTIQSLRYTCLQSLRMWYSHSMSRRALQEDCQMFSLLTLVAFGIIGTILVGIQHYFVQERSSNMPAVARIWTKGWLLFFLFTTFSVYFVNVYMLIRAQIAPWYRWWQSAREIKLILENRKTFHPLRRLEKSDSVASGAPASEAAPTQATTSVEMSTNLQDAQRNTPIAEQDQEIAMSTVCFTAIRADNGDAEVGGRRHALVPSSSGSDDTLTIGINNQQQEQEQQQQPQSQSPSQPQNEQLEGQQQRDNRDQVAARNSYLNKK